LAYVIVVTIDWHQVSYIAYFVTSNQCLQSHLIILRRKFLISDRYQYVEKFNDE